MKNGDTMQPIGGKKAMAICILKVLEDCSDFDHPMTQAEIIKKLVNKYGIEASRNAIGRNISLLCEMGYDISTYEDNGKGAYLRERIFDDMELRVLIDSVLSSKYIPEGDAKRIITKLGGLSSRNFQNKIPHVHMISEWSHQRNRQFFWNLEILSEAVEQKKQVSFTYNRVKADGELHPIRRNKDRVHPYAIVGTNGQYYMIASYLSYDNIRHYRIDRMTDIELIDHSARSVTEITGFESGLNVAQYAAEHNFMYGGKTERIVLKMNNECASDVIDTFGQSAIMEEIDEEYMRVTLNATIAGIRFFALQFGSVCEVLEPHELRHALEADVIKLSKKYIEE